MINVSELPKTNKQQLQQQQQQNKNKKKYEVCCYYHTENVYVIYSGFFNTFGKYCTNDLKFSWIVS